MLEHYHDAEWGIPCHSVKKREIFHACFANFDYKKFTERENGRMIFNNKMDYLPKDPAILVSSVNMLLRDEEFDSLESLCYAFSREPKEIKDYLQGNGFVWSEHQKQFRPIGYDA